MCENNTDKFWHIAWHNIGNGFKILNSLYFENFVSKSISNHLIKMTTENLFRFLSLKNKYA